jgi:hypothetical protein
MKRIKVWKDKKPRLVVQCGGLVLCTYELRLVAANGLIKRFNGSNVSDATESDVDEDMSPERDVFSLEEVVSRNIANIVLDFTVSIAPFDTLIGDIFEFTLAVLQDGDLLDIVAHYPDESGDSGRLKAALHKIDSCILKIQN